MATFKKYTDKKTGAMLWEWRGHVGTDINTGKRIVSSKKGFTTKRDAMDDFKKRQFALMQESSKYDSKKMTLEELITIYFEYKAVRVKPNTLRQNKALIKSLYKYDIIKPNMKIKRITPMGAQKIYDDICKQYKTPNNQIAVLKAIFNYAVKIDVIPSNPFTKTDARYNKPRKEPKDKRRYFEKEELQSFIKYMHDHTPPVYYYLFSLLARTGMRHGEARALSWSDVDFNTHMVSITKTVTRDENSRQYIGETPKTSHSTRSLMLDDNMISLLKEWKQSQTAYALKRGKITAFEDSLIFPNRYGKALEPQMLVGYMKKACEALNLPYISPHGLRHTYTALMLEAGETPINIAHTLGHSDTKMIMTVYDEMTKKRKANTAEKYARYIGNF